MFIGMIITSCNTKCKDWEVEKTSIENEIRNNQLRQSEITNLYSKSTQNSTKIEIALIDARGLRREALLKDLSVERNIQDKLKTETDSLSKVNNNLMKELDNKPKGC